MQIKNRLNVLTRETVRLLNRMFFIVPIKKNQILFESMEGRGYSDNPKYICEYILENYPNQFELIWAFKNPDAVDIPNQIKIIRYKSFMYNYIRATSKVLIQNMAPITFVPLRKKQLSINTWHGGGSYKRIGYAEEIEKNILLNWRRSMMKKQINLFVSSSEAFTKESIQESYQYHGDIINSGMPRNDVFFNRDKVQKASDKVKKLFKTTDFIVLYAPTYRGEYENSERINIHLPLEEIEKVIVNKYKVVPTFLIRKHYADKNEYTINKGIDVSNYPDMQDLLCAADILITDYSSSIWDYSFLNRPCYLFVYDLDRYDQEHGFYSSIMEWPGIVCKTDKELVQNIRNIDIDSYKKKIEEHHNSLKSYECGTASKQICDKIIEFMNK